MKKQETYNEEISGDEGFAAGDGYPSCEGSPCDNVAGEATSEADNVAAAEETDPASRERELEAQVAEWQDKYLRLQAEFDNFRKRTLREKMELVQTGGAEAVKSFLPLMDDLNRALAAIGKSSDVAALGEGVKLIAQKFSETLKRQNVTEIEALGLALDTDLHEAVARFDAGEEKRGLIVDVIQPGYKMGDKVLRFAKVVVGE
ncbi:MAG: nucleotide exchange factor GrpE [Alistipes sp.]|nr:nucleotide exchange factor GrpE [Alistipes sp.]